MCHKITESLIKSIRAQLTTIEDINMRMITSLSETCLILMQRWLTKCSGESMIEFVNKIGSMLDEFGVIYETLHPRARIAILGIASTALKLSTFKIDKNEKEVLLQWLPSACIQGRINILHYALNYGHIEVIIHPQLVILISLSIPLEFFSISLGLSKTF